MAPGLMTALLAIAVGIVVLLIIKLFFMVRRLNASFAKLGYVIREDAKKYFDDAAGKIVDTNEQFQSSYTQIVHDGTISALADSSLVMEKTLAAAHEDAGKVIQSAREDAQRITLAARQNAEAHVHQELARSADTIEWVMEQYVDHTFDRTYHEEIINKLLEEYINEHRD